MEMTIIESLIPMSPIKIIPLGIGLVDYILTVSARPGTVDDVRQIGLGPIERVHATEV
jgi:hypothetical protein